MSKRLDWLEEKERRQTLVPSILQIQAALSYEADELSSLLATVNKHQDNEIRGSMHLSSTQKDQQLTEPSAMKSGLALAGKIIHNRRCQISSR